MKKITLLVFVCSSFLVSFSQTPDWVWARSAKSGNPSGAEGNSIATDALGNVYITGGFGDTITFGSYTFTDSHGVFLVKYDSSGNVLWAKEGIGSGYANGIAIDGTGNICLTGYFFTGTISFGTYTLTNVGSEDIFVVKYDASGNVLWAKSAGTTGADLGIGVATDAFGNTYITGSFHSSIVFGTYTLTNAGADDIFLAKYDSLGNVIWAKSAGGINNDEGHSVATDAFGNIYITGMFNSSSLTFGTYTLTNLGFDDIFLTKYDSSGLVLWAKSAGGTAADAGWHVVTDAANNCYLTGEFHSTSITFGSYTLTTGAYADAFLVKYNPSGNVLWAKNFGGPLGGENGWYVNTDKFNKIYITGLFTSTTITFDTITLQNPVGSTDAMYLAEYDSSGNALFAIALASGGDDFNAVAVGTSGCIYIGGDFELALFIIGNDTLIKGAPPEEVFVAKLCYPQSGDAVLEISNNKEFIIYPNPFEDKLTASPLTPLQRRGEEEELTLYDVFGQVLLRRSFVNSATINTEQLACGIYFYEVRDKDGVAAREKLVKN